MSIIPPISSPSPVSSPCIDICQMDDQAGLCLGCGREIGEIVQWGMMSEAARRQIMEKLPQRIAALGTQAVAPEQALAHINAVLRR